MKLGDETGCSFNDRVDLELSPHQLDDLIELVEVRSMDELDYDSIGLWRELKDHLQERYDDWREQRDAMRLEGER